MSNEYLLEASRVMGLCLTGAGGELTINPELDSESLTIYLAVACTTLGRNQTRRVIVGEAFASKNPGYQEAVRQLEALAKTQDRDAVRSFLREMLLIGEHRQAVLKAGMNAQVLEYLIQDASELTSNFLKSMPDPKVLSNKLLSLTNGVCREAQVQIDVTNKNKRQRELEQALKVLGGAAARVTAAKLTGGVSEVLNKLGEVAIDKGLG